MAFHSAICASLSPPQLWPGTTPWDFLSVRHLRSLSGFLAVRARAGGTGAAAAAGAGAGVGSCPCRVSGGADDCAQSPQS
eukprot:5876301-Prymnesium_polylepis.1